jgi:hypothetical protein
MSDQDHMRRIQRIIDNRLTLAMRWHKLKTSEEVEHFVFHHPDVQELLDDADVERVLLRAVIRQVITADATELQRLRENFDPIVIDKILASAARHREAED